MSDIVERLRTADIYDHADADKICNEAADKIEKMRAALIEINDLNSKRIGYSKKIEKVIWEALGQKE